MLRWIIPLCLAGAAHAETLVFAAASLKGPVDTVVAEFDDVRVSYGGSGILARQIMQGAPADIVLLAHPLWMDELIKFNHINAENVTTFASNRLVLIGAGGPIALTEPAITKALGNGRIATGLTNAVPVGIYAQEALQSLNLWEPFKDHLAEVDNVRAALLLVARGQTPLGITYASDAQVSEAVSILATFPADSHTPIRYQAGLIDPSAQPFLDALLQSNALTDAGFLPPLP